MVRRDFIIGAAAASVATLSSAGARAEPFISDRISVTVWGKGPDIIFIPGLASHRDVFAGVANALSKKYRSHLVAVNGFAGIPAGANGAGPVMVPVAEEIARYIRQQQLGLPALIGHSMGGAIGMIIAARHRDVASRLMIVDMIPFAGQFFVAPDATSETARPRAEELARQVLAAKAGEVSPVLREMFSGMTESDEGRAKILEWLQLSDKYVVAQSFREVITTDLRPELSHIGIPVTVVYVPVPGHVQHPLIGNSYASVPQAHLLEIEDSKHFVMLDQPQRMLDAVETFMQRY